MKKINLCIDLYTIDELKGKSRNKAIEEHRQFLLSIMQPTDFISGIKGYDTTESLNAQYQSEYEYCSFNDEPVIESIYCNDYLFFNDGTLANVRQTIDGLFLIEHGTKYSI